MSRAATRRLTSRCAALLAGAAVALAPGPARAWLFHEHDRLGARSLLRLDAGDRGALQAAWQLATRTRAGARRYCAQLEQAVAPASVPDGERWCVGFSALGALAGDHACVPDEVVNVIEVQPWTGPLLVNARDLGEGLARLGPDARAVHRISAWREHNLALQEIDPGLVPRARNNGSHFLPALGRRGNAELPAVLPAFLADALGAGRDLNTLSTWAHYHSEALRLATAGAAGCELGDAASCSAEAIDLLWQALLAEGFALHFLEDAFSAGHIVGTWGDLGERLGSHDFYSHHGVDVRTWSGDAYVAHGDAFLSPEDEARATAALAQSLSQLAAAMRTRTPAPIGEPRGAPSPLAPLTVCDPQVRAPAGLQAAAADPRVVDVARHLPIPSSREHGPLRVRSEVGPFVAMSLDGSGVALLRRDASGLSYSDARLRVAIGPGVGLEGAFSRFMDGQLFAELMLVTSMHEYATGRPALGFGVRVRGPFAVLPGDLLYLVAPALLFDSDWAFRTAKMAVAGGVGRLERVVILSDWLSAQVMIGREATVSWIPESGWMLELPVAQLRSDHSFSGHFATESVLQLGAAVHWNQDRTLVGLFLAYTYRNRRFLLQE